MEVEVNLMAVLLAAISSMVVGSIWYAKKVFGDTWGKLAGVDMKEWNDKMSWTPMVGMFVLSLVMAYVLAHVTALSASYFTDKTFLYCAISSGFWMWIGFVVPTSVGSGLFEMRRKKLLAINAGNWLVTLLVMGWIIGSIGL